MQQRRLLPFSSAVVSDPRSRLHHGDFFAMTADPGGLDPQRLGRRFHAVLVDIDHSPSHLLHPSHAAFYTVDGLRRLAHHLHPGGVFGLWSNDPPDDTFTATMADTFGAARAHVVTFDNPLQRRTSTNTIYLAQRPQLWPWGGPSPQDLPGKFREVTELAPGDVATATPLRSFVRPSHLATTEAHKE